MDEKRADLPDHISVFELRLADLPKHMRLFGMRTEDDGPAEEHTQEIDRIALFSEVWIDGKHLDEPHFIDLPLLIQSLYVEGWRVTDIFTCCCGHAGCAGICDGITVIHAGELIRWEFRQPLSARGLDPALGDWEDIAIPVHFIFSRTQMLGAISTFLDAVRHLVAGQPYRFEWPVYGLTVTDVLKIDAGKPYYEIRKGI